MMRVILAWELGGNWGHAQRLEAVAAQLLRHGHAVHCVVQDLAAVRMPGVTLWQAPLWGAMLRYSAVQALGAPQSYGDVLANLGLQSASALGALLRGWDALLAAIRPDALVADFAPAALLAARGRVPRLALGTGFTVPPAHLPGFPAFPGTEGPPAVEEAALLALVNHALRAATLPELSSLPEIARAEALMPAVFAELDPYRAHRTEPPLAPFIPRQALGVRPTGGTGVFAYLPASDLTETALQMLERLAPKLTALMPGLDRRRADRLLRAGARLEERALPWDRIAADHGLVICNGGMGTVSTALVVGLPVAVLPGGIEQRLTARALQAEGLGVDLDSSDLDLGQREQVRAADRAADFRARMQDPALAVTLRLETMLP